MKRHHCYDQLLLLRYLSCDLFLQLAKWQGIQIYKRIFSLSLLRQCVFYFKLSETKKKTKKKQASGFYLPAIDRAVRNDKCSSQMLSAAAS